MATGRRAQLLAHERQKRELLVAHARFFGLRTFVETGTYKGDTVKAMLISDVGFEAIHTVDNRRDRAERARARFQAFPQVHCWYGDSAEVLPQIVQKVSGPALFWLDAHDSGKQIARYKGAIETPIMAELNAILDHVDGHVILIDDARYYVTFAERYANYPSLADLEARVRERWPDCTFVVKDDIIRTYNADDTEIG